MSPLYFIISWLGGNTDRLLAPLRKEPAVTVGDGSVVPVAQARNVFTRYTFRKMTGNRHFFLSHPRGVNWKFLGPISARGLKTAEFFKNDEKTPFLTKRVGSNTPVNLNVNKGDKYTLRITDRNGNRDEVVCTAPRSTLTKWRFLNAGRYAVNIRYI